MPRTPSTNTFPLLKVDDGFSVRLGSVLTGAPGSLQRRCREILETVPSGTRTEVLERGLPLQLYVGRIPAMVWKQHDLTFFQDNPHRSYRMREPFPGEVEFLLETLILPSRFVEGRLVILIGKFGSKQLHHCCALLPNDRFLPEDDDDLLRRWFDLVLELGPFERVAEVQQILPRDLPS